MIKHSFLAVLIAAINGQAYGFCIEPSAPYYEPQKPSVPWCVNEWDNTHTCEQWEIDSYNLEIENFNREFDDYVSELEDYIQDAVAFAKCKIDEVASQ